MKYAYEDLHDTQFEDLIVFVCQKLLGIAVQKFSEGADGGRDAKFVGTAELHPSKASPWTGTTVIQAKHTNGYNRSFSETDFYSSDGESSTLAEEIPRIRKLKADGNLDNYMLFANRKLSANAEEEIRAHIAKECGIPKESICLWGVEQLELFFKTFPEIPEKANLDLVDSPLIVSPDELAEVVQALARHKKNVAAAIDDPPVPRVSYDKKNKANNMSAEYARAQRRLYLKETAQITAFLADPENLELLGIYETAVAEFELKIIAKRQDFQTFDDIMEYLVDLLFGRDAVLRQHGHKRLTRAVLFYMYWNCDIGRVEEEDVESNETLTS